MYREIAKNNRKKLEKVNIKVRVYENNVAVDFYYKKSLCISVLTRKLDDETLYKYMIMAYNSYTENKKFGKKELINTL